MKRRNTIQKELVLNAVKQLKNHATADEVYSYVANEHSTIGKGTVYRNLNILAENGDIRRVEISDGPDRFDHNCGEHYHVECVNCGMVYDVDIDELPDLKRNIRNSQGVKLISYDILFKGICQACQKREGDL